MDKYIVEHLGNTQLGRTVSTVEAGSVGVGSSGNLQFWSEDNASVIVCMAAGEWFSFQREGATIDPQPPAV